MYHLIPILILYLTSMQLFNLAFDGMFFTLISDGVGGWPKEQYEFELIKLIIEIQCKNQPKFCTKIAQKKLAK